MCIKSGYVYEKRLILKQIELSGTDPVTGVEITASDLLPIQSSHVSAPKPISATSVQGLLGALQSEWDALMLETFTLRQTLETTRQELSQALYQHDAACRVIARLIQERDAARSSLASTQAMLAQLNASGDIASLAKTQAPGGLSQELIQAIVDKNRLLSKNVRYSTTYFPSLIRIFIILTFLCHCSVRIAQFLRIPSQIVTFDPFVSRQTLYCLLHSQASRALTLLSLMSHRIEETTCL